MLLAYGIASLSSDVAAKMKMFKIFTKRGISGHGDKQFKAEDFGRGSHELCWEIKSGGGDQQGGHLVRDVVRKAVGKKGSAV